MSEEVFNSVIMTAEKPTNPGDYDGAVNYCAKLIVLWLKEDPTRAGDPIETVYDGEFSPVQVGWYSRMKADGLPLQELGLSGAQWEFAVGAAKIIVGGFD